jgi:hypothetical protein
MARRVYFSFHYRRDVLKIGQIRNSWLLEGSGHQADRFLDKADWESIKKRGDAAIERWIDEQMNGTSVTVVLIGAETYKRRWVKYEIRQSHAQGKGMLGIDMYGMKDLNGNYDPRGPSPFKEFTFKDRLGTVVTYPVYEWIGDRGRANMSSWVEEAARRAGR